MRKQKRRGEIKVAVESNGREITLASLHDVVLHVKAKKVESSIPCGLRIEWACGEETDGKKRKFALAVGAGCGSPWMIFETGGEYYVANVEDIVNAFFAAKEKPDVT
jgi:hypothetical protein